MRHRDFRESVGGGINQIRKELKKAITRENESEIKEVPREFTPIEV